MGVSHVKSNIIADFTGTVTVYNSAGSTTTVAATNLVVPSDWNSAHNLTYNLGGNTSNTTQVNGTDVQFHGAGAVTVHGTGSTISFNVPAVVTLSSYAPFELPGLASTTVGAQTSTNATVTFWPMTIGEYVAAGAMNLIASLSFVTAGTSSGRQTNGYAFGLFSRGAGANSTTMGTMNSASFSFGVTYNNSNITINYPASTDFTQYTTSTTSSAGLNVSSHFTGLKLIQYPIGTTLSPGVYWLGMLATKSTSSVNCGFSVSWLGASQTETALAPINAHTSNYTAGTGFAAPGGSGGPWGFGHGSWGNSTNMPASVAYSAMTAGNVMIPFMKFWSS